MRAEEVANVLDVSVPYAYKLIRKLNQELKDRGCMVIAGRVDRQYFYDSFYGTKKPEKNPSLSTRMHVYTVWYVKNPVLPTLSKRFVEHVTMVNTT